MAKDTIVEILLFCQKENYKDYFCLFIMPSKIIMFNNQFSHVGS